MSACSTSPTRRCMRELRRELDIGVVTGVPGAAKGIEAKARIAGLLGIPVNCVRTLREKTERG